MKRLTECVHANPYELLACAAITPHSPMAAVLEAGFTLIEQGRMTIETRQAWDLLRRVEERLAVDFIVLPAPTAASNLEA